MGIPREQDRETFRRRQRKRPPHPDLDSLHRPAAVEVAASHLSAEETALVACRGLSGRRHFAARVLAEECQRWLGRQPALDGLRAVAIIPVMAFHAELSIAQGGYLGVDVFFVLSGFLITSLLLEELRDSGRIALVHFYARRALRLLPALALLLIALGLYALWRPHQIENQTAGTDIIGTAFYVFNWVLVRGGARLRMLSHAWSLSIEEQFYFAWPAILLAATWWWRRRGASVRSAACASDAMSGIAG